MDDNPRDRILSQGVRALSTGELIGAILGNNATKVEIAGRLLQRFDGNLVRMSEESPQVLARTVGLGPTLGAQIAAAFELARRWSQFLPTRNPQVTRAADVANFLMPFMRGEQQETLYVLCLNAKNVITNHKAITVGTLNASLIHPREVFRFAVENSAASVILAHNHPSGDPTPSAEDIEITKRLAEAGKTLEIPLLDHVIIADNAYQSLKDQGAFR